VPRLYGERRSVENKGGRITEGRVWQWSKEPSRDSRLQAEAQSFVRRRELKACVLVPMIRLVPHRLAQERA